MSKTRNWWFVLYPESAPEDWLETLQRTMIPFALSPLHEYDVNDDGSLKKAHYHVMLRYDGPTTYNHVLELTRSLNQPIPEVYKSYSGAYEYLIHLNNPEKYQYSADDRRLYNGFKVPKSDGETMNYRIAICSLILDKNIYEFSDLVKMALQPEYNAWLSEIVRNTYFYTSFIRSSYYRYEQELDRIAHSDWQSTECPEGCNSESIHRTVDTQPKFKN